MYGPEKVFPLTLNSGVTLSSSYVDLGSAWDRVYLEVPTFASGGTFYPLGTNDANGTFRRLHTVDPADGTNNLVQFAQSVSQAILPLPSGLRYYKFENTTGSTDAATSLKFHVS